MVRNPHRQAIAVLLAPFAALVLAGCGADEPVPAPGGSGAGTSQSVEAGLDELLPGAQPLAYAPATLVLETVDGGRFAAADVTGPVVYWFWAPWCTICRAEAPGVAAVAADFEAEVRFVGVAGLGPVDDMQDFVADTSTGGFEHVVDPDGAVWTSFGVVSQPSYVVVTADGDARTWGGGLDEAALREVAATLAG